MNNSKLQLSNRILWADGTNEIPASNIPDFILLGVPVSKIVSTTDSEDLQKFNNLEERQILRSKLQNEEFDLSWNIPASYENIDLGAYLQPLIDGKGAEYKNRLSAELAEISKRKLEDLFRTIIYIVDTFKNEHKVWGVGRGSSCASLVLFLIGLHQVDPIKYNIDMHEFFHD